MQFPQAAGLQRDICRCDGLGHGEVGRVDLVEGAAVAGHGLRRVLQSMVDPRAIARCGAGRPTGYVLSANGAIKDGRIRLGNVGEGGR